MALGGAGAHDVVVLIGKLRNRKLAANAAAPRERVAQGNAARLGRNLIRDQSLEPRFGAGTRDLVLRERREINDADAFAHQAAFISHMHEIVGAPEAALV